ncbi:MAG: [FeFe] hydrogenase H-cluster radical SAM maturase HydE [Deltaproteobacteria bacterium]|nr:[FeFe] hydrogenase H-cluster radical SAM maturase HydE [Deltaproteobacteria bacterium]
MSESDILRWLRETNESRIQTLYDTADRVRLENVGDAVHLRGLIEISNICCRQCTYCGIRAGNYRLRRYRLTRDDILACVQRAVTLGYGTVVMQGGEDYGISARWIAEIIRTIKRQTPLAVTLSLGERSDDELLQWAEAGADRYLLRFESSDAVLFARIHPPATGRETVDRIEQLKRLRSFGYEIGGGVMVGIPRQTLSSLAHDIAIFRELDLDMIGIGPYIPHPETPLGAKKHPGDPVEDQVPNTEQMTYRVVALARLVCPQANIPTTTALATINLAHGRELGLQRGANVIMPNLTPPEYRRLYEIYPEKACVHETDEQYYAHIAARVRSVGRFVGTGPGDRRR